MVQQLVDRSAGRQLNQEHSELLAGMVREFVRAQLCMEQGNAPSRSKECLQWGILLARDPKRIQLGGDLRITGEVFVSLHLFGNFEDDTGEVHLRSVFPEPPTD